jgi:hypothetical protein
MEVEASRLLNLYSVAAPTERYLKGMKKGFEKLLQSTDVNLRLF